MSHIRIVRSILRLAALATFLIGISLLIMPGEIVALFNGEEENNEHFAVYLGTALLGFGVANWLYSRMDDLASILPAIYGNLVSLIPATIIDVITIRSGWGETIIWAVLIVHIVFAAAFVYCVRIILIDTKTKNNQWFRCSS